MRRNKREEVLAAAVGVIEERGIEALTFESLAVASGLSKSGLIYHFPSRHALLLGVHAYLAQLWEEELIDAAGGTAAQVDGATRLRAAVVTMGRTGPRAELLLAIDASSHPDFLAAWERVNREWLPDPVGAADSGLATATYLVQLMSDGLWVHDHVHGEALPEQVRAALVEAVLAQIPGG